MPVIDIYHPNQVSPEGLLASLCATVTALLDVPRDQAWAVWHPLFKGNHCRPGWKDAGNNECVGPIVHVRCKSTYSEEQAEALVELISDQIAKALGCPADTNFVLLDRVEPGQLLARGEIWRGEANAAKPVTLRPVAFVRNARETLADDFWGDVVSELELDLSVIPSHSLEGLESFSHAEVVFSFHKVAGRPLNLDLRSPRGLAHLPRIGVLSQRVKDRPNWLGVSRCEILERKGSSLTVRGLDAIDGTPILDIKPWMDAFRPRQRVVEPQWVDEIMQDYYNVKRPPEDEGKTIQKSGKLRRLFDALPLRHPAHSREEAEIILRGIQM